MTLENQVCSLELAQKLKELGVKQESYFWWFRIHADMWKLGNTTEMMNTAVDIGRNTAPQFDSFSAFTVAELGEMLPKGVVTRKGLKDWSCVWSKTSGGANNTSEHGSTEADARATTLVYLIENNLITI